jgi:5-methylthioadenosine/S-adenosylhomocysteine deaminase
VLVENATVVTLDQADRILSPGWIRIEGERITEVADRPIEARPDEPRLDAGLQVVMPGLVNAHTHLFQTIIRGVIESLPFSEWLRQIYHCGLALSDDDALVSAQLGSMEALLSGTTTLVEHHFLNVRPSIEDASIEGMRSVGIRSIFARTSMDMRDLAPDAVLESPDRATAAADELLARHRGAVERGELTVMVGPNTPGVSASGDMAVAMTEYATDRGLRQSMHIAESQAVLAMVKQQRGVDGVIRWLDRIGALQGPSVAAHSVHVDADEMRLMAERDVAIVHNPVSNLFLGDGVAPIVAAEAAGITVALGTDGASSNNRQDMFEVAKIAALLQRGHHLDGTLMPPLKALRMATSNGARALGLEREIGSLEPGKQADLVFVDLMNSPRTVAVHDVISHLVHCAPSELVTNVFVAGQRVVENGRIVRVDQRAVLEHAQAAGSKLVQRMA